MNEILTTINENIIGSFYTMDKSVQNEVAEKVIEKIFSLTIGKYNTINFADIEKSRGDITKLKFYKNLNECIITLKEINKVTNKLSDVLIIENAINNLIRLKPEFEKSFRVQNNFAIMVYNLIVFSIMEATSYMIATSINFISDSDNGIIVTETNASAVLIDSLVKFNELAQNGTIYKFVSETEKGTLDEAAGIDLAKLLGTYWKMVGLPGVKKAAIIGSISVAVIGVLIAIVPLTRNIVYYFYKTKHKISETAQIQAEMLELNIKVLIDENGNSKVIARQQKWIARFKKIVEKFSLESDKGKRDSDIEISKDKIDVDNIVI